MKEVEKNADRVWRGYQAFNSGDMDTLAELIHENATWHTPGRSSFAGDYRGREAIFALFGRYKNETDGSFKAKLLHLFTSDDGRVVGEHRNIAQRNGKRLEVDCCIVFKFKDGWVMDAKEYVDDLYALDEFWA
ncbi:nuclear transport factor 2 family protein [Shewanella salipaludis]|uniref:SnoaL-like domain-containing protein n=1 Tax=Shewanella salipaludis TaxID=2723052 RepID=A0A972FW26_9GAMM|nr:nuclear transport factor 2 family protein [Shewanella salipaludis]NMH67135.1 SnoaL-like domain-containing protein [Shewanella salipaludis]